MLMYFICFTNDSANSFSSLIFPTASSVVILFYLFSLSSWAIILTFVAFAEKTRFMP